LIDLLKCDPYALILALLFHLALMLLFRVSPEVKFMDSAAPIESQLEDEAPQDDPATEVNEALPENALIVVVEESLLAEKLQLFQKSKNRRNVLGLKMPKDPRIVAMRKKAKEEQRRKELEEQRIKQEKKKQELEKKKTADKKAADKKAKEKKAAEKKTADKKAADKKAAEKKAADKKAADKKAAEKKAADKKAADKKAADKKVAEKKAANKKAAEKKAADKKAADKKAADKKAAKKKAADKTAAQKKTKVSANGAKSRSGMSGESGNARKKGADSSKGKSGGTGGGGSGRHSGGGGGKNYDKYKSQIRSKITRNWDRPSGVDDGLTTELRVKLFPGGAVADVSVARSSGNPVYDRSAQDAVKKASPLPVPKGSGFDEFRNLKLQFSPTGIR
jgi:colicin import membrane protein